MCGSEASVERWRQRAARADLASADAVPSSDRFGDTLGPLRQCVRCSHTSLADRPEREVLEGAYVDAADPTSLEEEQGQIATATRDIRKIERWAEPGRLLDIGSWTGSLLVAATRRGWEAEGVEPSSWAADRARARGCTVRVGSLDDVELPPGGYRAIVANDVVEHLIDPSAAVASLFAALEDGGVLAVSLPDAGSLMARVFGRRWWAIVPMHVQYFTRRSLQELLTRAGFEVMSTSTHGKTFSVGYFADRLRAFVPLVGGLVPAVVRRLGLADRMVTVDLRDRIAVVARKPLA